MASKFGGVPVDPSASGSKFGGVSVDDAPPSLVGGNPGSSKLVEPAMRFLSNAGAALNPVPGLSQIADEATTPGIGLKKSLESHFIEPQFEQGRKAVSAFKGTSPEVEGMGLPSRISTGLGHAAAAALPLVGPETANAAEQFNQGDQAGGMGSLAGIVGGVSGVPRLIEGAGKGMMRAAEPVAENALGIRNVDRAPAKQPGRAVLDYTNGVRPSSVAKSAGTAIQDFSNQRNAYINTSRVPVSLQPALDETDSAIAKAQAGNSEAGHLTPMREQLSVPRAGFQGTVHQPATPMIPNPITLSNAPPMIPGRTPPPSVAVNQLPRDVLPIRQRFGEDFTKFDVARPVSNEARAVGNKVYGKITDELHRAVPESAPLDKNISNLIPARDSASARNLEPGVAGSILKRVAARTGGLAAGAALGSHYGDPILGAALGATVPEMLSNPTAQMIAARSLNAAGKGIKSPIGVRALQAPALIRPQAQR